MEELKAESARIDATPTIELQYSKEQNKRLIAELKTLRESADALTKRAATQEAEVDTLRKERSTYAELMAARNGTISTLNAQLEGQRQAQVGCWFACSFA